MQQNTEQILVDHPLRNGVVVLTSEEKDSESLLHFRARINTRHPADVIFEQLVLGLTDSEKSWIWPLEYEGTPGPTPGGPRVGCVTKMTYRVPRFDKPELPAKPVTYSYQWPRYEPENLLLEYLSLDHPLQGGAVVRVVALESGGSRIRWDGVYVQGAGQAIVVESIVNYFPLLYETIESLIEAGAERQEVDDGCGPV